MYLQVLVMRISSTLLLSIAIALPASAQTQSANDLFCRGAYELRDDRYSQAFDSLSQAIRANPRFTNAYYYRGIIHHYNKRYREAIQNYNQALNIGTDLPAVILANRASALASLGDHKQALEDLKLAIKYSPNDTNLQRALVFTFLKLGSRKSAIAVLEKMVDRSFRAGQRDFYLETRDELQAVRSGGAFKYRWGFSWPSYEFEKGCPR